MYGHPDVIITSVKKIKNERGEYWYRFAGVMNGALIRDTVDIPAAQVDAMGMEKATDSAKRNLRGLARYLEEKHART